MGKRIAFLLNVLGWLMLLLGLVFGVVRDAGLNPQRYFDLQMRSGILQEAGISEGDLMLLDENLAHYLGGSLEDPNAQIQVFGRMQYAFNARELKHLADCKGLFAPVVNPWLKLMLALAGVLLVQYPRHRIRICGRSYALGVWCASALILLPVGTLALWAAVDFSSAFTFFHRILFTNDLWLLNPETDLLIRICPASMFAHLGLRIALGSAGILLGLPLVITLLQKLQQRKRKTT